LGVSVSKIPSALALLPDEPEFRKDPDFAKGWCAMVAIVSHARAISVHKEHELLLRLEAAGFTDKEVQKVIESKDNRLARKLLNAVKDNGKHKRGFATCLSRMTFSLGLIQDKLRMFLKMHPEWDASFSIETDPPEVRLRFWLKSEAFPRRKAIGGPEDPRCEYIRDEEMDVVAVFVATLTEGLHAHPRNPRSDLGFLEYLLTP
jgi:hypothetical protein